MKLVLPVSSFNERPLHTIRQGKRKVHTHTKRIRFLSYNESLLRAFDSVSSRFYKRKRAPPFYLLLDLCGLGVVSSVCRLYPAVSLQRYEVRARSRLSVIDLGEGRERKGKREG
ncbi:hypothetical protein GE21DRAFT_1200045 [Neurospora crassa]|nr:hypothetical protein 1A9.250 [imported] - Neurospora crassa [Neurospora crassa]KHE88366.1 hypothetical protein GE21DRAFT_1200045 [Neurospora crassa]